jgi:hypothetical protein
VVGLISGAAHDPLADMVSSYLDDPEIELRADDPKAEHRLNTWHYSAPAGFDPAAVAAALDHVVRQLSQRRRPGPAESSRPDPDPFPVWTAVLR